MADPRPGLPGGDAPPPDALPVFRARRIDVATWLVLGAGVALACVFLAVPMLRFVFSYLTVLIHELGHAVVGWAFGYPSIPAFDFTYGGGITTIDHRSSWLLGFVYVLLVGLLPAYRRNLTTLICLVVGLGVFALCAHTAAHKVLILFMGHGMELLLAGVFLYRALSGSAVVHAAERPLYAACGVFIVFSDMAFAYGLWASPHQRAAYASAKGGGHMMDFSRIAIDYLGVKLPTVAFFFLLCCVLPVVLSFVVYRYQERLFHVLAGLVEREPS